ncbi:MAG: GH32 C-terminal domain-containing protein [Collinsella sp.]|uniref:GH32 C-terminal domain-containing protein n=1 Tax=Collinsella sp. LCP19S3_B7 TaxID=3438756 RepID=UPI002A84D434|nr:GH32 C-terminal domain-containing protein [Collinsella sp.]MCI6311983.1 GH32 C-terminal domain-containing protein [Collinsella sp.]MCI6351054.1 GH32 C-terminal domain-containing protein [Collinsella sp.]MCI6566992.1 GH32 C-terminal domain-containing protein [Collinsella sp.]MCI6968251.1 GH32 C-terminal domain-containing protein [Collinsella sp.]
MLCKKVRIVGDVSSVEVLVNDGALVFSTRIYPEDYGVTVDAPGANVTYHAPNI